MTFTFTEGIIIASISAVVSIVSILVFYFTTKQKLEKEIREKYHEKLFDERLEVYKKMSTLILDAGPFASDDITELKQSSLKIGGDLLILIQQNSLILDDKVVEPTLDYIENLHNYAENMMKNGDISIRDEFMKEKNAHSSIIVNEMRKNINLEEISSSFLKMYERSTK